MKNNWKEELKNLERLTHRGMWWVRLDRVEEILAEQKKELIEKLDEMAFKENVRYSSEQKRMSGRVGEKAWNSIIKEKDILVIRSSKLTQLELSKEYGVSRECISAIKNKRTWSHIK